ncbi:ZIP family metal transporter [Candidatus Woesearchaeota archaeon]|nr:ZIP family metal transporter [Candidatus Woesearchaeota archaeon]
MAPSVWLSTILSVLLVSLISFVGVLALSLSAKALKNMLIYFVSFAAGALFGDAFLHLLPEAVEEAGFGLHVSLYILIGIAFSFVVEKVIHWRHCHLTMTKEHAHPFAVMNLTGDAVHNFIDGLVIGASYLASFPVGVATTIAVVLHEIPQEIGDFGVLIHGGYTKGKALFFNFLTALTAVVGAIIALAVGDATGSMTSFLVPFAAGGFIYIAGSDLIPELHKEIKADRSILQLVSFLAGIGIMVALLVVE